MNEKVEVKKNKNKNDPDGHSTLRYIITTPHKFLTWNIVFEKVRCDS